MKARSMFYLLTLCFLLVLSESASTQISDSRPRRVTAAQAQVGESVGQVATLGVYVPREGLHFYLELREGGLGQLAGSSNALAPVMKTLLSGSGRLSTADLTGFMMSNLGTLSAAKLGFVSYGAGGAAALIEASSQSEAERLGADLTRLLGAQAEVEVSASGRLVAVGAKTAVARLSETGQAMMLSADKAFVKARQRFSSDPLFAYIELGSTPPAWPGSGGTGNDAAYTAGMLAALSNMPYAVAVGGSLQADTANLRALVLHSSDRSAGLFSSIISSTQMGQARAASFAAPDADLFVDVMIDWNKLYETIQSLFAMFAGAAMQGAEGAQTNGAPQGGDMFGMLEASLGFSIKNDLIPTLGNELAITLTNLDGFMPSFRQAASAGKRLSNSAKVSRPQFMLMVAVKEPAKFEKLVSKLLNQASGKGAQPFMRSLHRGATINYSSNMAFVVSNGFFIAGGSPAEIRRALDAHAAGTALAATQEFRTALGEPRPTMMQVYLSGRMSGGLVESLTAEAAKADRELAALAKSAAAARAPLGLVITPDTEGMMVEMRVPSNLALMGLASMATSKPAAYGIHSSESGQSGASRGARSPAGSKSPRLTDDDLVNRKP